MKHALSRGHGKAMAASCGTAVCVLIASLLVGCSCNGNKGASTAKQQTAEQQIGRICARAHEHPLLAVRQLARVSPPPGQEAAYRQWGRAVIDYILDLASSERLI